MTKAQAKELTHDDPKFLPAQFDLTDAKLTELAKEYDPKLIPKAKTKGDEPYQIVHSKVMAITKIRTAAEAKRKELKADALAWGKKVDTYAKGVIAKIEVLEEPWRKIKTDLDEKEAREAEEARQAEIKRMKEIEARVQNIKDLANGLLTADAATIQERLVKAHGIIINEEWYGDYIVAAQSTLATVYATLENAHTERLRLEKEQAEVRKQQEELAEDQRKMAEQQAELDKQKAAQDEREAAEKAQKEIEDRKAQEEREERERVAAEKEAAKKSQDELKKRSPEDAKLREYADALADVLTPTIKNEALKLVQREASIRLNAVINFICVNTQGGK